MQIPVSESAKKNFFVLSLCTLFQVTAFILRSLFAKILLVIFISLFLIHQLLPAAVFFLLFFKIFIFLTVIYFIIQPLLIAIEESIHMGICIQQGKSTFMEGLTVSYLAVSPSRWILVIFVAAKFRGKFKLSEKIQIHGGAPLLILLFLNLMLFILLFTKMTNFKYLLWTWIFLVSFPVSSLIPFKFIFKSDGYCILKDTKSLGLSISELIKELMFGIYYGLRYLFLGSSKTKKTLINNQFQHAFELVQEGNLESAVSILEKGLQDNPDDSGLLNNIAWCYSKLNIEIDKAVLFAQQAIELNPNEATYYDTLGWCYFIKGDINNAKQYIVQAIEIDPHNSVFLNHLRKIEGIILTNSNQC